MDLADTPQDWKGHATREATVILNEVGCLSPASLTRDALVALLAATWLQGVNYGAHTTLNAAELAFERARDEIIADKIVERGHLA